MNFKQNLKTLNCCLNEISHRMQKNMYDIPPGHIILASGQLGFVCVGVTSSVAEWLERSLRVWEARVRFPAESSQIFQSSSWSSLVKRSTYKGLFNKKLVDPLPE